MDLDAIRTEQERRRERTRTLRQELQAARTAGKHARHQARLRRLNTITEIRAGITNKEESNNAN